MLKNTGSQTICFQAVSTTDGSAVTTGTPTVYVLGDGGTQSSGGGAKTHEGQGTWSYVPSAGETNYSHVVYTFVLSGAINHAINVYPSTFDYTAALTGDTIADQVWEETQSTHTTAGSFGYLATEIANIEGNVDVLLASRILLDTTIVTVNTQTNLTLTTGGGADDIYVGATVVFIDAIDSTIVSVGRVSSFDTGTLVLETDTTHTFNLALNDRVIVLSDRYSTSATASEIRVEMDENSTQLSEIAGDTNELQLDWTNGGRLDAILDARSSQVSVDAVDTLVQALNNLSSQGVRDAMKLAPTAGSPSAGSVDLHLDDIESAGGGGLTPQGVRDAMKLAPSAGAPATASLDQWLDAIPTATENAVALEAAIINEGDGQQVIDAILQVINTSLDLPAIELAAIGAAVRTELTAELALIDASVASRSTVTTAEVLTQATSAITTYDPPTDAEMIARTLATADYGTSANQTTLLNRIGAFTGTATNSVLGFFKALMRSDATDPSDLGGTFTALTDSTQSIRDNHTTIATGGLTQQNVRDAMKLAPSGGGGASGSIDTHLDTIEADTAELQGNQGDWATATGFSTHTAANVRTEMDSNSTQLANIVADTDELQADLANGGRLDLIFDALTANVATANGVVDDILLDTAEIGAAGIGLTNLGGASASMVSQFVDGLLDEGVLAHITTGSLGAFISAIYDYSNNIDGNVTQVLADTDELQTDWEDSGRLDLLMDLAVATNPTAVQIRQEMDANSTQLAAIFADTDELQTDGIAALIGGLNDLTAQAVRDAMKLAPVAGAAASGSIDYNIATVAATTVDILAEATKAASTHVAELTVTSVTTQTELVVSGGETVLGIYNDHQAVLVDTSSPGSKDNIKIVTWDGTDTIVLEKAAGFTVDIGDTLNVLAIGEPLSKDDFDAVSFSTLAAQEIRDAMKLAPTAGSPASGSIDKHMDDIESAGGSGLSQQQVRDALKLAPSAGSPSAGSVDEELDTALARVGAFAGSGANTILGFLQSFMRTDATLPTDVGGTYDPTTDSNEAIRNNHSTIGPVGSGGSITVTAANYGQDGDDLSLKRGNAEVLVFTGITPDVTMSDVVLGIRDNGRSLIKIEGVINGVSQLTFTISSAEALNLYQGTHQYDVFELEGYNSTTGAYTDSRLVLSGDVTVDPLYVRLEST
jgi:hypothetical protein